MAESSSCLIHALQQVKEKIPVCQDALPYTVIQLTYSISLLLLLVSRYGWETCVHEVIILLSGAEYLKEIELNEREIDLLGTCPLKIHVQLLPANIN